MKTNNTYTTTSSLLSKYTKLDHNIKLYIPSTINVNKSIDNKQYILDTLKLFSSLFGGSTSYKAQGAWDSETQGLIVEDIAIVESYTTSDGIATSLPQVLTYATKLKKELAQEAISLEYDNQLYFI